MFDYYTHVNNMTEDQLVKEIERLTTQLLRTSPTSPVYQQMVTMLHTAEEARDEYYMKQRFSKEGDEIIEVGTIESSVAYPEYNKEELLNVVVDSYITPKKGE